MDDPLILKAGIACGAVMTAQHRDGVVRLARALEAGGFDSIWAGDHISFCGKRQYRACVRLWKLCAQAVRKAG